MRLLDDDDRRGPAGPAAVEGTFIDTATAAGDQLRVVIPAYDGGVHFHPVVWAPRAGAAGPEYPSAGDVCLVVRSERGRLWASAWTPTSLLSP